MIELKKEFDTNKYHLHHRQLFKDGDLVIYEISQPKVDDGGYSIWYEVFKYMVNPPDQYHDDEYELYPKSDEYYGIWAWSCSNIGVVDKVLKREFPNHPMAKNGFGSHLSIMETAN